MLIKPIVAPAPLYALARSIPSYPRRLFILAVIGAFFMLALLPWAGAGQEGIVRNVLLYAAAPVSIPGAGPAVVGILRVATLLVGGRFAPQMSIDRAILLWALLTIVTQPFGPEQQYSLPIAAGAYDQDGVSRCSPRLPRSPCWGRPTTCTSCHSGSSESGCYGWPRPAGCWPSCVLRLLRPAGTSWVPKSKLPLKRSWEVALCAVIGMKLG